MQNEKKKYRFGMPARATVAALLTATALSGCAQLQADLQAAFQPRIELLTEIEQDLYRAILASDKIEKLRVTSKAERSTAPRKQATAPKKAQVVKTTVEADVKGTEASAASIADAEPKVTLTVAEDAPKSGAIYLSKSEINPVQLTFQGDAHTFFERVADDIDYKVVEVGSNRMVDLNIKANGEPLFGVAIRAANYVEKDMRVRFDMEEKVIRIEYLDQ